jgi:hypothetical protein
VNALRTGLVALAVPLSGCLAGRDTSSSTVVPLVTTRADGVADSQVVPVRCDGRRAWLALDTGAPFTFLFSDPGGDEYVEDAGEVELGGMRRRLPGYRDDAIGVETFRGRPIVGVLGLDWFADAPAAVDYPGGRIVRYQDGVLPEDERLPTLPLRGRDDERALVTVMLDGEALTLMLDTGAHDTILIDRVGDARDEVTAVQTADGRVWPVHVGEALLALPGEAPRTIPVLRAGDLAYVAPELRELGADGLLGLTALGWRRIVFDFDAGVVRLGPLEEGGESSP